MLSFAMENANPSLKSMLHSGFVAPADRCLRFLCPKLLRLPLLVRRPKLRPQHHSAAFWKTRRLDQWIYRVLDQKA